MIGAMLAALLALGPPAFRTIDGDTVELHTPDGPAEVIRLEGIDAPETGGRARCDAERLLAARAKAELARFLTGGDWTIDRVGTDRYGRTLARIEVNGIRAGDRLITEGLAVPWAGRRHDWCS